MHVFVILLDIGFLVLSVTSAIYNRGTWVGWLFTAFALWQIMGMISAIKSTYDES